jgi:hypothetical protein
LQNQVVAGSMTGYAILNNQCMYMSKV